MENEEEYWAQLVSLTDIDSSPILINKTKFLIGRNEECDLSFSGNKLVSGNHCYIEKHSDGTVWLNDSSTNGTLLNMKTKIVKGECHELQHGDEFHVIFKKNSQEENIGYLYQDRKALMREENSLDGSTSTEDYYTEAEKTLSDNGVNQLDVSGEDQNVKLGSLKRKADFMENFVPTKKTSLTVKSSEDIGPALPSENVVPAKKTSLTVTVKSSDQGEEKPGPSGVCAMVEEADDRPSTSSEHGHKEEEDEMLESLSCVICQGILHDCISLQPCLHSFCSGCYSEWMEQSNQCPSCRVKVDRINKNHLVNNLVEAFLKTKPGFKRSSSELDELDMKNKITRDMLYPAQGSTGINKVDSFDDGSSGTENEDDEDYDRDGDGNDREGWNSDNNSMSDSSDDYQNRGDGNAHGNGAGLFGFGTQPVRPANPECRQCPNYTQPVGILPPTTPNPDDVDDEDRKEFPPIPAFQCRPSQSHVLCLCCLQPMPDRRREFTQHGTLPPQQCSLCFRSFCHAYWGCRSMNCNGCIGKLKDLNFGKKSLTSLVLGNAYESNVLKDHLTSQSMSVKSLLAECLAKMVVGQFTCINQEKLGSGINTPVCYGCGLLMFKDLAYQYRRDIPNKDLPEAVTKRPDCYWGKNCRTQRNKPEHAQRYNHICEQSRTS